MASPAPISPSSDLVLQFDPKRPTSLLPITKAIEDRKLTVQQVPQMCAYVGDLVSHLLEVDPPSVEVVVTTGALLVAVTRKKTYWKGLASDRGIVELLMDFVDHWKSLGIDSPEEYTPGGDNLRCLEEHLQFAHAKVCKEEGKQRAAAAAEAALYQQATSEAKAAGAAPTAVPAPTNMSDEDAKNESKDIEPSTTSAPAEGQLQDSVVDELLTPFSDLGINAAESEVKDLLDASPASLTPRGVCCTFPKYCLQIPVDSSIRSSGIAEGNIATESSKKLESKKSEGEAVSVVPHTNGAPPKKSLVRRLKSVLGIGTKK